MAEGTQWISPELFHFSLSPFPPPPLSAAHERLRPVCDVAEERSQNELITDEGRRAFESWHQTTFFKHLKIVTVGLFFFFLFRFVFLIGGLWGILSWLFFFFLETGIITRFFFFFFFPLPPFHFFFHFVIGSLFNLVMKIGLAWERQNSFGERFFCCCCFRVVRIVIFFLFFFLSAQEKRSAGLCQNLMKYR